MSSSYDTAYDKYVLPKINTAVPKGVDGWQLYTAKPGADAAAQALTTSLHKMLSDIGQRFVTGMKEMDALMSQHSALGACDTEPRCELREAVEKVLGYLAQELF